MSLRLQTRSTRVIWTVLLAVAAFSAVQRQACSDEEKIIEHGGRRWVTDSDTDVTVTEFGGRPALNVRGGLHSYVYLPDVHFGDGTIEVDVAAGLRGVPGIGFRGSEDGKRVDKVAFRFVHPSPSVPEFSLQQAVITRRDGLFFFLRMGRHVKEGEWVHVKLIVLGEKLKIYVNDAKEPVLVVDKMLDHEARGSVGVWGLQDCYYANFRYTPAERLPIPKGPPVAPLAGRGAGGERLRDRL